MAEPEKKSEKIQIEWGHSSVLLKAIVSILIVFSMAALAALGWVRASILNQTDELRAEASALENRNAELEQRMDSIDSVQTIHDIAQEELGLVDADTVLIQPQ